MCESFIGQRIGSVVVLESTGKTNSSRCHLYLLKCDCGNTIIKSLTYVRKYLKCGCGKQCKLPKINYKTKYGNLENKVFGKLLVLNLLPRKAAIWSCRCDCGYTMSVDASNLVLNKITMCKNCANKSNGLKLTNNLIGRKFGNLLVLSQKGSDKYKNSLWLCRCYCGKEKTIVGKALLSGAVVSCGCYRIYKQSGKLSPWYKDGSTRNPNFYKRNSREYSKWVNSIKKRDNHTCQICGFKSVPNKNQIVAHHIDCYRLFPEKRMLIENGITLCKICHKDFHSRYSNSCTRQHFLEYILLLSKKQDLPFYSLDKIAEIEKEYLSNV